MPKPLVRGHSPDLESAVRDILTSGAEAFHAMTKRGDGKGGSGLSFVLLATRIFAEDLAWIDKADAKEFLAAIGDFVAADSVDEIKGAEERRRAAFDTLSSKLDLLSAPGGTA